MSGTHVKSNSHVPDGSACNSYDNERCHGHGKRHKTRPACLTVPLLAGNLPFITQLLALEVPLVAEDQDQDDAEERRAERPRPRCCSVWLLPAAGIRQRRVFSGNAGWVMAIPIDANASPRCQPGEGALCGGERCGEQMFRAGRIGDDDDRALT